MKGTWPLVGRKSELEAIASTISSGTRGVVISGPAGVGKTRLAAECLALATSRGFSPVRVAATASASSLPFGTFAHLLPDIPSPTDQTTLLRRLARTIRDLGNGRPVAIMVDDAHLLDDSSAALTHQLVEAEEAFVVATLRSAEPAPEAILRLWKDGLADRLELHPLSDSEVEELLHSALGGPIDGLAVEILKGRARGNALFLRELVLGALDSGTLAEQAGVWRLNRGFKVPERLAEIVESRLAALSAVDRGAVEMLACGEPLGIDLFQQLEPEVDLEGLERLGLIRVEQDGRRAMLYFHHPLHAEVLRSRMPALVLRRNARMIAETIEETGARRRSDVLLVATKRLEGGGPSNPQVMLQAARMARMGNDLELAERLARAALNSGMDFEAELLIGQVCWHQGRAAEADRVLRELAPKAKTDKQQAILASVHSEVLHLGLGNSEEALRVAENAELGIKDASLRDELIAARARILGRCGKNAEAAALVEPLLARATGVALVNACFAAGTSMPLTGQFDQAMKATALGYAAHCDLDDAPVGFSPHIHQSLECYALVQAGYPTRAHDFGMTIYAKAVSARALDSQGFLAVSLASSLLAQGRPATAEGFAGESVGVFRQVGWGFMERLGLIELVMARALRGKVDEAEAALRELDGLGIAETDLWGPRLLQSRAWVAANQGDVAEACHLLRQAVEMARSGGAFMMSCAALYDLARLGKAKEVARVLHTEAVNVEGRLAPLQAWSAAAQASGEPVKLEEASTAWERMGALLLAAELSTAAAVAWRRKGNRRKATSAGLRAAKLHEPCEGAITPVLSTPLAASVVLTPRELEIARLAATGHSDRTIAQELFLSPRTVGNALYSAYQKLGVGGRADLAGVLLKRSH